MTICESIIYMDRFITPPKQNIFMLDNSPECSGLEFLTNECINKESNIDKFNNLLNPTGVPPVGGVPVGGISVENSSTEQRVSPPIEDDNSSYGIICYRIVEDEKNMKEIKNWRDKMIVDQLNNPIKVQYLMIHRQNSFAFHVLLSEGWKNLDEFIRLMMELTGKERCTVMEKYRENPDKHPKLRELIVNGVNENEINLTMTPTTPSTPTSSNAIPTSSSAIPSSTVHYNFNELMTLIPINFDCTEWEFAKGKAKSKHETPETTAIREFIEETGIRRDDFNMSNVGIFEESHVGTNDEVYRYIYYIANYIKKNKRIPMFPHKRSQKIEVKHVAWLDYEDIMKYYGIRNPQRAKLLENINEIIISRYKRMQYFHTNKYYRMYTIMEKNMLNNICKNRYEKESKKELMKYNESTTSTTMSTTTSSTTSSTVSSDNEIMENRILTDVFRNLH